MTRELFSRVLEGSTMDDRTPYGCTGDMRAQANQKECHGEVEL